MCVCVCVCARACVCVRVYACLYTHLVLVRDDLVAGGRTLRKQNKTRMWEKVNSLIYEQALVSLPVCIQRGHTHIRTGINPASG